MHACMQASMWSSVLWLTEVGDGGDPRICSFSSCYASQTEQEPSIVFFSSLSVSLPLMIGSPCPFPTLQCYTSPTIQKQTGLSEVEEKYHQKKQRMQPYSLPYLFCLLEGELSDHLVSCLIWEGQFSGKHTEIVDEGLTEKSFSPMSFRSASDSWLIVHAKLLSCSIRPLTLQTHSGTSAPCKNSVTCTVLCVSL